MAVARIAVGGGQTISLSGYLTADETNVKVVASPVGSSQEIESASFAVTNAATGRWFSQPLPSLAPNVPHQFYVKIDNVRDTGKTVSATTLAYEGVPTSRVWCFGSCYSDMASGSFAKMDAHNPIYILTVGDNNYGEITTNDQSLYQAQSKTIYDAEILGQSRLWNSQWDDWDYSGNDSDSTAASKPAAVAAARYTWASAGEFVESSATYYSFVDGRVRFVMLDVRSERTGSTMLGSTQQTWLNGQIDLAKTRGEVIIINTSNSMLSTSDDAWSGATHSSSRDVILNYIVSAGMQRRSAFIGGDTHELAADDGTGCASFVSGAEVPVFIAAPLGRFPGAQPGTYSETRYAGSDEQYGRMELTDNGGESMSLSFSGRDINDVEQTSLTVNFTGLPHHSGYASLPRRG